MHLLAELILLFIVLTLGQKAGAKIEDIQEDCLFQDLNMQLGGAILFSKEFCGIFKTKDMDLVHLSSIQGIRAPKFDHYAGTFMTSS